MIAAWVNAINRCEFETVWKIQDHIERTGEHNRRVRSALKVRKRIIAAELMERDHPGEPSSGDEGESGIARN